MDLLILPPHTWPMTFDEQLDRFRRSFDAARRNPWHGGDLLHEEFRPLLSALGARPAATSPLAPHRAAQPNPWQEAAVIGS